MTLKNKIYLILFILLEFVSLLFFLGFVAARSLEASGNVPGQEISPPASVPEQHDLTLVSFSPLVVEGKIVGTVAAYHDPTTERPVDYWEFYDSEGGLMAVDWFDRFGIERMAVDRGLLEDEDKLEGVFVVLPQGDPL